MKLSLITTLACAVVLSGCDSLDKKKDEKNKSRKAAAEPKSPAKEQQGDAAFQSFVSRLRIAATTRDLPTLATLMTNDFGYRWDDAPQGETAFDYWDQNNLWPQLGAILNSKWGPHEGYMVVPPQMTMVPNYDGYRAGIAMVEGEWKFSYFVPAPPPE